MEGILQQLVQVVLKEMGLDGAMEIVNGLVDNAYLYEILGTDHRLKVIDLAFIQCILCDKLQLFQYYFKGNELMEEMDKSGISTLYFLSKKAPIKKEEIKSRIKKGV